MSLTKEQIRYAIRVITNNSPSDFIEEDIKEDVKKISNLYSKYRNYSFENAYFKSRVEWLEQFFQNPEIKRRKIGTVIDLYYMLSNLDSSLGLLLNRNNQFFKLKEPYQHDNQYFIETDTSYIEDDFPYLNYFPQDIKRGDPIRSNDITVGSYIYKYFNRIDEEEYDVYVILPNGDRKLIQNIYESEFNNKKVAIIKVKND